jgi:phosphoglycolate phosphatase-like HAD superfamily hydrolase
LFFDIYSHLQWQVYKFDYIGISSEVGKSRPDPAMIFDMMKKLKVKADQFLKVGDTIADIQEGKNAGVKTVVLLSGTQPEKDLMAQSPDFAIHSLQELVAIIESYNGKGV